MTTSEIKLSNTVSIKLPNDTDSLRLKIGSSEDKEFFDISTWVYKYRFSQNPIIITDLHRELSNITKLIDDSCTFSKLKKENKESIITAFINLLQGTEMVVVNQPNLYQELCRQLCVKTEYQEFKLYLDVLLDDRNERWFKENLGEDREEEIKNITFTVQNTVRTELLKDKISLEKIRRWFLLIYDLDSLARLERKTTAEPPDDINLLNKVWNLSSSQISRLPRLLTLKGESLDKAYFMLLWSVLFTVMVFGYYPGKYGFAKIVAVLIFIAVITNLFSKKILPRQSFNFNMKDWVSRSSTLLRLIGCIMAGYFAILSDESFATITPPLADETSLIIETFKISLRWIILGSFTYIYIFREIRNRIKSNFTETANLEQTSHLRARKVFFKTALYSLVIGIMMSAFLWQGMINKHPEQYITIYIFKSWRICPEMVLHQAPLAMFIGIFINLLWEDKALTEPL